jgi:hypothetical protein
VNKITPNFDTLFATSLEGLRIFKGLTAQCVLEDFESNHPLEHKTAAFRYHITRMHLLPLTAEQKQKEWKIIQHVATKNNFPQNPLQKLKQQIIHTDHPQKTNES